jgi:hypothetical protein
VQLIQSTAVQDAVDGLTATLVPFGDGLSTSTRVETFEERIGPTTSRSERRSVLLAIGSSKPCG